MKFNNALRMNRLLVFLSAGFFVYLLSFLHSCKKETVVIDENPPVPSTGVSVDLTTVPYAKLSQYRFFQGAMKDQSPADRVIPYAPATPLFTDYAKKRRFIWLPNGTVSTYSADNALLDLPVGAALIKTFYYDNVQPGNTTRIIETRVMIRKSTGWIFAEYVWNDAQTEAFLDMDGSYTSVTWDQGGVTKTVSGYRIPSATECLICHKKNAQPIPIGIKAQNLNTPYTYSDGTQNQLQKLISVGYLQDNLPASIVSTVNYLDASQSLDLRLRSYLDANCAHCHAEGSHCDYRPMKLAFTETANPVNLGLCVPPDEYINASLINILTPTNINKSMMHFRLNSTEAGVRMPLLGRSIKHDEGVQLLEEWITAKLDCN